VNVQNFRSNQFDPKPIQLLEIFKYLFRCNINKGLYFSKKMWLSAALLLTMVLTLDSS